MAKVQTTIVFEELLKSDDLNKRIVVAQGLEVVKHLIS